MRLPIRNYLTSPLALFLEPLCIEFEIPPGGEAIITLEDGRPHSIDYHPENWVSVWDEGSNAQAAVEVFSQMDLKRV